MYRRYLSLAKTECLIVKLGAGASAAAGPKGRHIEASTDASMRAEILASGRALIDVLQRKPPHNQSGAGASTWRRQ